MYLSELKPLQKNPFKSRGDKQIEAIGRSIQEFEKMMEIRKIVIDEDYNILGGNKRYFALKALGRAEIPDSWVDQVSGLTEAQKREFIVKDNSHWGSEWDFDLLKEWNVDLSEWGVSDVWGEPQPEATEDDYEIPDEIVTDIVVGDLFEIGSHRLLCGDSTDAEQVGRLMGGVKADMVFTDPPYGIDYSGQIKTMFYKGEKGKIAKSIVGDKTTNTMLNFMPLLRRYCNGVAYIFCGAGNELNMLMAINDNNYELINTLIWNKPKGTAALNSNYKPCFEIFYYIMIQGDRLWSGNNSEWTVWDVEYVKNNTLHPTQKPIELVSKALNNHKAKSILDLFLGSGSTMVAAHQLNRTCYGMELDPQYCQVIIDRMRKLEPGIEIKKNGEPYQKTVN